jgi:hypothetical protein
MVKELKYLSKTSLSNLQDQLCWLHAILLITMMLLGLARILQFYNQSVYEEDRFTFNTAANCLRNISCRQQLQNISTWWKFEVLVDKCNTEKTDIDTITIYVSYNDDIDIYIIRNKITVISFKNIFLIVVFPCMLTIIQLLFQQNAHVFYY